MRQPRAMLLVAVGMSLCFAPRARANWFHWGAKETTSPAQSGSEWYPGDGNVRFLDLTGKLYPGSDDDLIGIQFMQMGIYCEGSTSYRGDVPSISWSDQSGRFAPTKPGLVWPGGPPLIRIRNYTIRFRVKDRRGQVIHEEAFEYIDKSHGVHAGQVYHDRDPTETWGCERDYVKFNKTLNLAYTTIEYWLEKITWKDHSGRPSNPEPDRIAFPVSK